ncbi:hypothetical protein V6N11_012848 [Hibiscus sabdariffa]|uniref:Uncharacterized protein n=2 Tax=Hibiscus sabdariffa TaxID=183260 RepID=A0ABR1ZYK7_9ROSI
MRGIWGPLIVASILQIVLGFSGLRLNVASIYLRWYVGSGMFFDRFAVTFTAVIVGIYARLLTVDSSVSSFARQREAPSFDAGESFAMMAASFVALIESTGTFIAVSRYASATPLPLPFLAVVSVGRSLFIGLSIPQYFNKYTAFNETINVPFSSEAFVAGLLATFHDVTLHGKDNTTKKDHRMHWWDKFRSLSSIPCPSISTSSSQPISSRYQ